MFKYVQVCFTSANAFLVLKIASFSTSLFQNAAHSFLSISGLLQAHKSLYKPVSGNLGQEIIFPLILEGCMWAKNRVTSCRRVSNRKSIGREIWRGWQGPGHVGPRRPWEDFSKRWGWLLLCCWKRVFAMTSVFSWQSSISLCPASFCTPRPNLPVIPGISWLPTFAFQSPIMKRTFFLGVSSRRSCRSS